MKILFKGNFEELDMIKKQLKQGDFEFVFSGEEYQLKKVDRETTTIIGKNGDKYFIIDYLNIIYVESFGHDIICHTVNGDYTVDEKLYEIAGMFENYGFIRIHKSYVVNKKHIASINPELNRKFKLILSNGNKIEVSRKYFLDFKQAIGMKVKV